MHTSGGRLKRAVNLLALLNKRLDQLPAHVRDNVGGLGRQDIDAFGIFIWRHARKRMHLNPVGRQIGRRNIIGTVGITRPDLDLGPCFDKGQKCRDGIFQNMLETDDGFVAQITFGDIISVLCGYRADNFPPSKGFVGDLGGKGRVFDATGHVGWSLNVVGRIISPDVNASLTEWKAFLTIRSNFNLNHDWHRPLIYGRGGISRPR